MADWTKEKKKQDPMVYCLKSLTLALRTHID